MPASTIPIFKYADLAARWGVSSQRLPQGLRVVVPPVPGWRYLPRWYSVVCTITTIFTLFPLAVTIAENRPVTEVLPPIIMFGPTTLIILTLGLWRLHERTIIDVTHDELAIIMLGPWRCSRRAAWPRKKIIDIKRNLGNNKLLIRITGEDYLEYFLSANPQVTQSVADEVAHSVFHDTFDPASPADAFSLPTPRWQTRRLALILTGIVAAALLILASILIRVGGDWAPLGVILFFLVFLVTTVTAGITLGTQDKDFYC